LEAAAERRKILSPLRGLSDSATTTHGFQPWLHSYAAPRLKSPDESQVLVKQENVMLNMLRAVLGIGIVVAMPQGVVMQRNLSLAMAKTIAEATLAECKSKGFNTAAAVVDRAGQVLVILRDEQATAQQAEMARRKAYTARMFRTTTLEFQKRTSDSAYAAQRDVADILALGGGVPIQVGNDIIGGVGSSGSSQEMDDACAKAGIAKVADLLK
jgi:uncharacterized protein GlcG (DUF336 family)